MRIVCFWCRFHPNTNKTMPMTAMMGPAMYPPSLLSWDASLAVYTDDLNLLAVCVETWPCLSSQNRGKKALQRVRKGDAV